MNILNRMVKNEKEKELEKSMSNLEVLENTSEDYSKKSEYEISSTWSTNTTEKQLIENYQKNRYNISIDEYMGKEKPPEDNVIIIIQDGGIGDSICATPMLESMRKIHKDKTIVFASFYPDIFYKNPNIDYLYSSNNLDSVYEKWVKNLRYNKSMIKKDIYNSGIHKLFPGKLSEAICYLYGAPYPGDNTKVYLTEDEEKESKKFLKSFPRDVILIHPCASKINYKPDVKLTTSKDWDDEYWKELVSLLTKDFDVVQVGGAKEKPIEGVTTYLMGLTSIRQTMSLVKNALTTVSVDSFIGHVSPAVGKTGVVLFGRSNPYIFGHDSNINVWIDGSCELNDMFCGRPQSYWGDNVMYKGTTKLWECPNRTCMKAIKPELVYQKVFDSIEKNTIK